MDSEVWRHCEEVNRCNQRGGRMLSVPDLIDASTLDLDLAAFLMAHVSRGASFLVGTRPGGAGKTTVMCALLNLLPRDCEIVAADRAAVRSSPKGTRGCNPLSFADGAHTRRCYVCHEIGSGPYFAYLWGGDLRAYCALSEEGHVLATNLHADDLDEAREQICAENRVPAAHFNAFHLALFLRVRGGYRDARRWVERVYLSDGKSAHQLVFDASRNLSPTVNGNRWIAQCRAFLDEQHRSGIRTIEEVRSAVVGFLASEMSG